MSSHISSGPMRIDLGAVLRSKLGAKRAGRVPRFLVRMLERIICQERLNELLAAAWPREGAEFCDAVLREMKVELVVDGKENLPADGRAIFVCNHPLGGLDGIAIIDALAKVYGPELHFLVNDILMAVEPLKGVFLPVNKHGAQSRSGATELEEALAGPAPLAIFPAGLCSRRGPDGRIADLQWRKSFVSMARRSGRPIVPLYFEGRNSNFFYRLANLRKRLGIGFNLEMIRLPRELVRASGSRFRLVCGTPVDVEELGTQDSVEALRIRQLVYSLASEHKQ